MNDPSIDILTQRLAEAEIDPQLRDALATDLDWAAQINGNPDPSMQGVKRLVVSGVRRELLACDRDRDTKASIEGIVRACAERHAGPAGPAAGAAPSRRMTALETAVWFAKELAPWRWPVAVAVCSPWTAQIIQTAAAAFTKQ